MKEKEEDEENKIRKFAENRQTNKIIYSPHPPLSPLPCPYPPPKEEDEENKFVNQKLRPLYPL